MRVGDLEIRLFAGLAELRADMEKARSMVGGAMNSITGVVGKAKTALAALGVGIGVGAFTAWIKGAIDAADRLNDLSKTSSLSVETLSGLSLAAKQSGSDLEGTAASINKLAMNMGKDAEKFKELGITAKDPLEAFKQLADIFGAIEDPQLRAATAAAALGKQWQSAAPLLEAGSEAIQSMIDRGIKLSGVTKEIAQAADDFNDKMEELNALNNRFATELAAHLLPHLTQLVELLVALKEDSHNAKEVLDGTIFILKIAATGFLTLATAIAMASEAFVGFIAATEKFKQLDFKAGLDEMAQSLERAGGRFNTLAKTISTMWEQPGLPPPRPRGPSGLDAEDMGLGTAIRANRMRGVTDRARRFADSGGGGGDPDAAFKRLLNALQDRLRGEVKLTEVQKLQQDLARMTAKELGSITAARREQLMLLAKQVDVMEREKANVELGAARRDNELDLFKLGEEEKLQALEFSHAQMKISDADYFAAKVKSLEEISKREIENLNKSLEEQRKAQALMPHGEAQWLKAQKEIEETQHKIIVTTRNLGKETAAVMEQARMSALEYKRALEDVDAELAALEGRTADAALIQFDRRMEKVRTEAANSGRLEDVAKIDRLRAGVGAKVQSDEERNRLSEVNQRLMNEETRIQNLRAIGAISELEAMRRTGDARQKVLAEQEQIVQNLERIARGPGGTDALVLQAEQARVALEKLRMEADVLGQKFEEIFTTSFADAFGDFIDGTKSAKEAFDSFTQSVVKQINRMVAEALSKRLFEALGLGAKEGQPAGSGILGDLGRILGIGVARSGAGQPKPTATAGGGALPSIMDAPGAAGAGSLVDTGGGLAEIAQILAFPGLTSLKGILGGLGLPGGIMGGVDLPTTSGHRPLGIAQGEHEMGRRAADLVTRGQLGTIAIPPATMPPSMPAGAPAVPMLSQVLTGSNKSVLKEALCCQHPEGAMRQRDLQAAVEPLDIPVDTATIEGQFEQVFTTVADEFGSALGDVLGDFSTNFDATLSQLLGSGAGDIFTPMGAGGGIEDLLSGGIEDLLTNVSEGGGIGDFFSGMLRRGQEVIGGAARQIGADVVSMHRDAVGALEANVPPLGMARALLRPSPREQTELTQAPWYGDTGDVGAGVLAMAAGGLPRGGGARAARKLSSAEEQIEKYRTLYHGTSERALRDIDREGLVPHGGPGGMEFARFKGWSDLVKEDSAGSRADSVFFAKSRGLANEYADIASSMVGGQPVVLEYKIPESVAKSLKFIQDEMSPSSALRLETDSFPSKYINRVLGSEGNVLQKRQGTTSALEGFGVDRYIDPETGGLVKSQPVNKPRYVSPLLQEIIDAERKGKKTSSVEADDLTSAAVAAASDAQNSFEQMFSTVADTFGSDMSGMLDSFSGDFGSLLSQLIGESAAGNNDLFMQVADSGLMPTRDVPGSGGVDIFGAIGGWWEKLKEWNRGTDATPPLDHLRKRQQTDYEKRQEQQVPQEFFGPRGPTSTPGVRGSLDEFEIPPFDLATVFDFTSVEREFDRMLTNVSDTFGSDMTQVLGEFSGSFGSTLSDMLGSLAQQIFVPASGGGAPGVGGLGNAIGSMFGGGAPAVLDLPTFDFVDDFAGLFLGGFASGIDRLPRTGLALVHEGERIVPARDNNPDSLMRAALAEDRRSVGSLSTTAPSASFASGGDGGFNFGGMIGGLLGGGGGGGVAAPPPGVSSGGGGFNFGGMIASVLPAIFAASPGYAGGISLVPETGLALIHKGEQIVPAAENNPRALMIRALRQAGMEEKHLQLLSRQPDSMSIPAFEQGGYVGKTGLSFLHEGEQVLSASQRSAGMAAMSAPTETSSRRPAIVKHENHFHVQGTVDGRTVSQIEAAQFRSSQRSAVRGN